MTVYTDWPAQVGMAKEYRDRRRAGRSEAALSGQIVPGTDGATLAMRLFQLRDPSALTGRMPRLSLD